MVIGPVLMVKGVIMDSVREIVLDTETTGLDPLKGDRLVEIGCLELINHLITGKTFHIYINPERDMPEEAYRIHGLSIDFLSRHPTFDQQAEAFLAFIDDSPLVIHNASFDMNFLNAELRWLNKPEIPMSRAIDTLDIARKKFPGAPASLDALCRRYGIDNSNRTLHGALLDSELLADVYLELIGGKQPGLTLQPSNMPSTDAQLSRTATMAADERKSEGSGIRALRPHAASAAELEAHQAFIAGIKSPIWSIYQHADNNAE